MSTDLSRRPRSLVRENDTEAQKIFQEYSTPEGGLAFLDLICSLWLLYSADRILCSICIIFWGYTDLKNGSNSYQTAKKTQLTKT